MPKMLIGIFVLGLMLHFAAAYTIEQNWVFVKEKEDNLWFINADSVTCIENICRAWLKILSLKKDEYTIGLYEYDCTGFKYKISHATKYDSNGNVISRVLPMDPILENKVPASIDKELSSFVCKKAKNQKEQQIIEEKQN